MKLKTKISSLFIILSVLPLAVVILITAYLNGSENYKAKQDFLEEYAVSSSNLLQGYFREKSTFNLFQII